MCRPTFSKSLMVSVTVSKLGCSPLFFVEPGVEVDGRYYREVLLKQQILPVTHRIAGVTYVFQQDSAPSHPLSSYCSMRLQSSLHPTCGSQTALTWTRSITVSGVSCRITHDFADFPSKTHYDISTQQRRSVRRWKFHQKGSSLQKSAKIAQNISRSCDFRPS